MSAASEQRWIEEGKEELKEGELDLVLSPASANRFSMGYTDGGDSVGSGGSHLEGVRALSRGERRETWVEAWVEGGGGGRETDLATGSLPFRFRLRFGSFCRFFFLFVFSND